MARGSRLEIPAWLDAVSSQAYFIAEATAPPRYPFSLSPANPKIFLEGLRVSGIPSLGTALFAILAQLRGHPRMRRLSTFLLGTDAQAKAVP